MPMVRVAQNFMDMAWDHYDDSSGVMAPIWSYFSAALIMQFDAR